MGIETNTFRILKSALGKYVKTALLDRGFAPYRSKSVFPERYYRERDAKIDVVRFYFDKYARPMFRIEFRSIEDHEDLESISKNSDQMWNWLGHYRLLPPGGVDGWHKLSLLDRLFAPSIGSENLARRVRLLINDLDEFLKVSTPSEHIAAVPWIGPSELARGHLSPPRQSS